jgi:hypothetical protein
VKKVFVAQHPTEAHLVKGLLESQGIPAEVRGEALFGTRGEAPVSPDTLPTVWVFDDRQTAEALEVLRGRQVGEIGAAAKGESWQCPNCSEMVEPQFTVCWQCGADKPSAP